MTKKIRNDANVFNVKKQFLICRRIVDLPRPNFVYFLIFKEDILKMDRIFLSICTPICY